MQGCSKFVTHMERAVIASRPGFLHLELPEEHDLQEAPEISSPSVEPEKMEGILTDREMRRRERANLMAVLQRTRWKIYGTGGAAELLGVKPTTLASRIKKLGLQRPASTPPPTRPARHYSPWS